MTKIQFTMWGVLSAAVLVSCSSRPRLALTDARPPLVLEKFFVGQSRSWGLVEDRFGKVRKTLSGQHRGVVRGSTLNLAQSLHFADGAESHRSWRIERLPDGRYLAHASHIEGAVTMESRNGAVHLRYRTRSNLPGGESGLEFDQWLWLQSPGVLLNRADIRKYGIRIARLTEVFVKEGNGSE